MDTPIGDLQNRMGQLTTSLLTKYGADWTYSVAVNDLYYDFAAPSLQNAGIDPAEGYPRNISAGDGSVPAFQRIRDGQYQVATVAEPLYLHGWQTIDELNRAFAGEAPSGYVAPPHLFLQVEHRQGRRRRRTSSTRATATGTSTRRSGAFSRLQADARRCSALTR